MRRCGCGAVGAWPKTVIIVVSDCDDPCNQTPASNAYATIAAAGKRYPSLSKKSPVQCLLHGCMGPLRYKNETTDTTGTLALNSPVQRGTANPIHVDDSLPASSVRALRYRINTLNRTIVCFLRDQPQRARCSIKEADPDAARAKESTRSVVACMARHPARRKRCAVGMARTGLCTARIHNREMGARTPSAARYGITWGV